MRRRGRRGGGSGRAGSGRLLLLPILALGAIACTDPGEERMAPPRGGGERGRAVARIGDELLTREDVSAPVALRIHRLEVDIYSLLRAEAEREADRRLLEREAARRGTTSQALLAEVEGAARPPTEAEVEAWLAEHPPGGPVAPEVARVRARTYLEERARIERRLGFLAELRRREGFEWLLEPPAPPRTRVPVEGAPARGPEDAPVVLVHFAGLTGRESARSAARIRELAASLPGALREIHRHLFRPGDEGALLAAELGCLAHRLGRFWELHDRFAAMERATPEALRAAARELGLPAEAVERADRDPELLRCVRRDLEIARRIGIPRPPAVFVNGRYQSGLLPVAELRRLVEDELASRAGPREGG